MIIGILCILYYIAICKYLRRWNSRFPRFWLILGLAILLFEWKKKLLPVEVLRGVRFMETVILVLFGIVELLVISGMRRNVPNEGCRYLIVLGAKVDGYHLTDALRQRMDAAIRYLRENPDTKVIVSGGQGHGESLPEGRAMAAYLRKCGIAPGRILTEEKSTTTRENLAYSGKILLEDLRRETTESARKGERKERHFAEDEESLQQVRVGVVTNSFHMYRAVKIAGQVGYGNVAVLPAPTTKIMLVNYMTREFFGVLKMWVSGRRV
ncbi:YdcF family protein [Roseburia hominis]